jgi:hypothetical protein
VALQLLITAIGARGNGLSENEPCNGGANKNKGERQNLPQQEIFSFAIDRIRLFARRLPKWMR